MQVSHRALKNLDGGLRNLRGVLQHLAGTFQDLRGAFGRLASGDGSLAAGLLSLIGTLEFLRRAFQILHRARPDLGGILLNQAQTDQILFGTLQISDSASQKLRGRHGRLRGTFQILQRAAQQMAGRQVGIRAGAGHRLVLPHLVGSRVRNVGAAIPDRSRCPAGVVGQAAVLLADQRHPVETDRSNSLGGGVPITIGGHDREILLAGILYRITGHASIDPILFAGIVPADASQRFARRR